MYLVLDMSTKKQRALEELLNVGYQDVFIETSHCKGGHVCLS